MKLRLVVLLFALLMAMTLSAAADKAPLVQREGSAYAACHLSTHIYAFTHGWDGQFTVSPAGETVSTLPDDGCGEYGHVHCYGTRVTLWDTPMKGTNNAPYKSYTKLGYLGKDTAFELVDVVRYRNRFYAMVRIYEHDVPVMAGWVDADYIGCDCTKNPLAVEEIPIYRTEEYYALPQ